MSADLSVVHAALLMAGITPGSEVGANCDGWETSRQPPAYVAAKAALTTAIKNNRLEAKIRRSAWHRGWDENPGEGESIARAEVYPDYSAEAESPGRGRDSPLTTKLRELVYRAAPDWNLTTVEVEALRAWLSTRGIRNGFFFPQARHATDLPAYLDKSHPRYAPKLAASLVAWERAEGSPDSKSPKETLEQILYEIAADFGLIGDDGRPNKQGIEECSKVANWRPRGGAPKTPAK
ncbi:hypothetical protein [Variovorax boronicumulans]|uniref:hypothetical protein n=1 Tax=Variovorax boronicumulans TaxID=436515 RepID=UPI00078520FB|nr:hypothetical protein [Variovorax boronicumulans]